MKCIVVTPEKTVLEQDADFVALPLSDGEMGVCERHTPMVGRIGAGELRVSLDGKIESYYVESGFAEIYDDVVTLMVTHAWKSSILKVEVAEKQLADALARPHNTPELAQIRERKIQTRRARLRLARKVAGA
ncbi:MAG: ATP synthase F1 subunit epsilon [Planctomycetaceae bacterium]|jgi:F-type H+-transporting ATPase subunit epsilon|nr:ATP synthase F1 subunit epsilon [Planctomycetaceae bacterium]